MKKNLVVSLSVILLCTLFFSCKDNNAFTISGTVNNPGSLKKIYLLEDDSSRITVVDSTSLSELGKFQFKHAAPYANMFKIRMGGTIFDFIAKNGDAIDFTTNLKDNTHAYQVTGSAESERMKAYNKISNYYVGLTNKMDSEYQDKVQALGKESDSLTNAFMPEAKKLMGDYNASITKFISENKHSLAGFYAVTSLDVNVNEQALIAYADSIRGEFKDNPNVQRFIKQMEDIKAVSIGHKAPDFAVAGVDGKPIKLSDYKGKYVMLDFWASWCAPCRAENPNVVKQYAVYKSKGLNILGISLDQDKDKWTSAIADDKLTWQHGSDLKNFEGPTERLYHIEAIPSNFIIDPKGTIIAKNVTGPQLEEFLKQTFSKPQ